jgi:hypothetical protein
MRGMETPHKYHQMFLDTINKNIHVYGLGVGISTVSEIAEHFLFKGGTTPYVHDLHTIRCSLARGTGIIYNLGVGISTVFKIFSYFNFLGVGLTLGVMTYIPLDAP